jgi:hypothetical protein
MNQQLDLVTLKVSPEEARKIATALQVRSSTLADLGGKMEDLTVLKVGRDYMELRRKVERQTGVNFC